jgi:putative hydrolase of the HAD superfamily
MIKNVVFDIGNVLAQFRYKEYIKEIGIAPEMCDRVAKATAEGPYWPLMDKGVLTAEQTMLNCIALDPGAEPEIRLFFKDMHGLVVEYPDSCEWIQELKNRGMKVYLLSNYSKENFEMAEKEGLFKFLQLDEGRVISYTVRMLKPDAAIYNLLLEKYGLDPKECVFLDDSQRNVEAAEKLGMRGILVDDREWARAELDVLLDSQGVH